MYMYVSTFGGIAHNNKHYSMQLLREPQFLPQMHQKLFGGWGPPRPAGRAYIAPQALS